MTRVLLAGVALLSVAAAACRNEPTGALAAPAEDARARTAVIATGDGRKPLPLLPMMANHQKENMRDHLAAVQELSGALAVDDFGGVERAATRIGFSPAMGQMCTHMGMGAPGFTEQALAFHHAADKIAVAARARDHVAVLTELSATLRACTTCHATWRQEIVDDVTWKNLTGGAAPHH